MKTSNQHESSDNLFDLDDLLHPARAFAHPRDVLEDADLTVNEKRAVLASWASDACAVEAAPALRLPPGTNRTVSVDDILEALRELDKSRQSAARERRQDRRRKVEAFRARRSAGEAGGRHELH
jgi:hypothetical protein